MFCYLSLRDYDAKLFLVGVPHPSDRHVLVPAKNASQLSRMNEELIGTIEEAIAALQRAGDLG